MSCALSSFSTGTADTGSRKKWWLSGPEHGEVDWAYGLTELFSQIWCAYSVPLSVFGGVVVLCLFGFIRTSSSGGSGNSNIGGSGGGIGGDAGGDC